MKKVIASLLSVAMVAAMAAGCAQTTEPASNGGDDAATPDASAADAGDDADASDAGEGEGEVRAMRQPQRQCLSVLVLK
ncbi:MAG: hypothetical protein IJS85_03330 [Clostridiales bacterium]|nr:hypothetical protein [Clostridiales bacterium]